MNNQIEVNVKRSEYGLDLFEKIDKLRSTLLREISQRKNKNCDIIIKWEFKER
jgi:hypothetical protein